ncbi:hypothetical protein EDB85DRAFT_1009030 [Lactarius pseudohatsudake]|nr:hypothetical protein EDB85DRAFT_1198226 [Lactarius pseudohatsudake]KAH9012716.1 hypothetical protein EDB85DRAFT_1009030 [Lactarius pseudohatsudake]
MFVPRLPLASLPLLLSCSGPLALLSSASRSVSSLLQSWFRHSSASRQLFLPHAVRIPRALAPKSVIFGSFNLGPAPRGLLPYRTSSHSPSIACPPPSHTHSLLPSLSLVISSPSLTLASPWTPTDANRLANGSWALVVRPRVPALRVAFVHPHSVLVAHRLSFEHVKTLRNRRSLRPRRPFVYGRGAVRFLCL